MGEANKMEDTIYRQTAIDAIKHHAEIENDYTDIYHDGYCDGIFDAVDTLVDLPPAQPEPQWTLVSKGLPKEAGWYLCTYKDGRVNTKYWSKGKGWVDNVRLHMFELYDIRSKLTGEELKLAEIEDIYWDDWVKAWMPLPEPYKGE